jgi:hypothetical protein
MYRKNTSRGIGTKAVPEGLETEETDEVEVIVLFTNLNLLPVVVGGAATGFGVSKGGVNVSVVGLRCIATFLIRLRLFTPKAWFCSSSSLGVATGGGTGTGFGKGAFFSFIRIDERSVGDGSGVTEVAVTGCCSSEDGGLLLV